MMEPEIGLANTSTRIHHRLNRNIMMFIGLLSTLILLMLANLLFGAPH